MRINKYIALCGVTSRRGADGLIALGRVKINERVAVAGDDVGENDRVYLDGRHVLPVEKKVVLAYNKPVGVTCSTVSQGSGDISITDAIAYETRVFPVGRLDKASRGLILLTNDGDLADHIMKASNHHEKEYEVTLEEDYDEVFLESMSRGVTISLEDRDYKTRPCKVFRCPGRSFRIVITEGKNRQIRRMCDALGHKVCDLKRIRVMNILLEDIREGEYRVLSDEEVSLLSR